MIWRGKNDRNATFSHRCWNPCHTWKNREKQTTTKAALIEKAIRTLCKRQFIVNSLSRLSHDLYLGWKWSKVHRSSLDIYAAWGNLAQDWQYFILFFISWPARQSQSTCKAVAREITHNAEEQRDTWGHPRVIFPDDYSTNLRHRSFDYEGHHYYPYGFCNSQLFMTCKHCPQPFAIAWGSLSGPVWHGWCSWAIVKQRPHPTTFVLYSQTSSLNPWSQRPRGS